MKESLTTIFKNDSIQTKVIDGKIFLIDIDSSQLLELNAVGTFLWNQLASPCEVEEVIEKLVEEFEVNSIQAKKDVLNFLKELKRHGLISLKEAP